MPQSGSMWVEGTELHYIDGEGNERAQEGYLVATGVAGKPGSIWIDGGYIYYIDANGDMRRLPTEIYTSASGTPGSIWIEGKWVHFVYNADEFVWHEDASGSHNDGYTDWEDDPHSDWSDGGHNDWCDQCCGGGAYHMDHADTHTYNWATHGDWSDHVNHGDTVYCDSPHRGVDWSDHYDGISYSDHANADPGWHTDDYYNEYCKGGYSDHYDGGGHSDWTDYSDTHSNWSDGSVHSDEPHLV